MAAAQNAEKSEVLHGHPSVLRLPPGLVSAVSILQGPRGRSANHFRFIVNLEEKNKKWLKHRRVFPWSRQNVNYGICSTKLLNIQVRDNTQQ